MPEIIIDNTGTQDDTEVKSCWELEEKTPETCEDLEPTENTEPEGNEEPQETDETEDGEVLEIKYLDNTTDQVIVAEPAEKNAPNGTAGIILDEFLHVLAPKSFDSEKLTQEIWQAGSEVYPLPMSIFQHENMQALKDEREALEKERDELKAKLDASEKECLKLGTACQILFVVSAVSAGVRWYKAYSGLAKRLEEDAPEDAGKQPRWLWFSYPVHIFVVSVVSAVAVQLLCRLVGDRIVPKIAFAVLVPVILAITAALIGDFLADRDE